MDYQILNEIGRGTFGKVEEVQDIYGTLFARKTFLAPAISGVSPADLQARFEREVKYQSTINHPNVVRIVDFDIEDSPPWFLMERAECSLADELAADRTLGGNPGKPLFDILSGLEAMHELGYKHRDLKPANVLRFSDQSGNLRYALSDFGLMAPEAGTTSTLTASNMGGGTPLYMAPECVTGLKRATTQSDIYSFGAILHDIFAGGARRTPYTKLTVSGPLKKIIERCTETNVRRRYKNVAILRQDLYEVLSNESITFISQAEKDVVDALQSEGKLSDEDWDRIFEQIDQNRDAGRSNHAIFRVLTIPRLEELEESSPPLFASLGEDYAEYIKGAFNFDYCDVLAGNAAVFYQLGELDLKAKIVLGMLELGTSHNRWFVERRFLAMVDSSISDLLAQRIKVEVEVQKFDFRRKFKFLEYSIGSSVGLMHPILLGLLEHD